MKNQKTKVKKGSTKPPEFTPHEAGILLEEIRDQVKLVAEAVNATRETLEKETTEIRGIIEKETTDIRGLISQVQSGLEKKIDETQRELKQEILITKQELKAEIQSALVPVNSRLDRHEEEITRLKSARG